MQPHYQHPVIVTSSPCTANISYCCACRTPMVHRMVPFVCCNSLGVVFLTHTSSSKSVCAATAFVWSCQHNSSTEGDPCSRHQQPCCSALAWPYSNRQAFDGTQPVIILMYSSLLHAGSSLRQALAISLSSGAWTFTAMSTS